MTLFYPVSSQDFTKMQIDGPSATRISGVVFINTCVMEFIDPY